MKIVEAKWERRNFKCDAWEITLEHSDMSDIDKTISALNAECFAGSYVCIKIPVGNLRMLHALEDDGFRFLETQLSLMDRFNPDDAMKFPENIASHVYFTTVERDDKEGWERIIAKIVPEMFDTDRISLDPLLGPDIACERYRNWIRDLRNDPRSKMTLIIADSEPVAFSLDIIDGTTRHGVIGGTFPEFKNTGYGMFLISGPCNREQEFGSKARTVVSSNNLKVLRAHQNCGKVIYKEMYVLRKFVPALDREKQQKS